MGREYTSEKRDQLISQLFHEEKKHRVSKRDRKDAKLHLAANSFDVVVEL